MASYFYELTLEYDFAAIKANKTFYPSVLSELSRNRYNRSDQFMVRKITAHIQLGR